MTGTGLVPPGVDTLASLEAGNTPIAGFSPTTNTYTVNEASVTSLPTISAVPTDGNSTVSIAQAAAAAPTATVTVTAPNGNVNIYTVNFTTTQAPQYVYYIDSGATTSNTSTSSPPPTSCSTQCPTRSTRHPKTPGAGTPSTPHRTPARRTVDVNDVPASGAFNPRIAWLAVVKVPPPPAVTSLSVHLPPPSSRPEARCC